MNDDKLRRLLHDAVSDVEPEDRLDELRASVRTPRRVVHHLSVRPWYAAAGIVAAVICLVAYVTSVATHKTSEQKYASDPSTSPPSVGGVSGSSFAVFYLGDSPKGKVLFQETVPSGGNALNAAISALGTGPTDPDYKTAWGPGTILSAQLEGDVVTVHLGAMSAHRPQHMSARTADEIVQQAVYTFRSASGRPGAKVQFLRHDRPATSVLGVPTDHPVAAGRVYDVLSLMSLSSPREGQTIARGPFEVTGTNNGPEANVVLKLVRSTSHGDVVVRTYSGTADGNGGNRMYPWSVPIDTTGVAPGRYTLVASNEDLSGGTEGVGPATDTRTIVLQ